MEKGEALLCSWARFGQAQPAALGLAAHCRKRAGGHWPVDPENASDKGGGGGILGHEAAVGNRFQAEVGSEAHQMRCSLAARVGKGEPAPGAWIVGHRHRFVRGS
jgi:hypothetical protein